MKYILSIGMNDYRNRLGGTNKVILEQRKLLKEHGYGYIYICPVKERRDRLWEIILNNRFYCIRSTEQLLFFLYQFTDKGSQISEIHIHHLLGVSIDEVDRLLSGVEAKIKYYIHDYYTICPSVKLLKNDVSFCGTEKMTEQKCEGCKYFAESREKNARLRVFLKKYENRIVFVIPSDAAKEAWIRAFEEYEDRTAVIYHQELQGNYMGNREPVEEKIKVGYLGETSYSKGWDVWNGLIDVVSEKPYYFFHFGKDKEAVKKMKNVSVNFQKKYNAMVNALRTKKMDCVLLWSLWEETYSYTYYESLASNTFVITNKQSGNIARQVEIRKNGIVLDNEQELTDLFQNFDVLKKYINDYKVNGGAGPDNLSVNPQMLAYIDAAEEQKINVSGKMTVTWEETLFSIYYKILQIFYCMRKVLL